MKLELKLFATLRPYLKGICEDGTLEVPDNTTVADVIKLLKLPEEQVDCDSPALQGPCATKNNT